MWCSWICLCLFVVSLNYSLLLTKATLLDHRLQPKNTSHCFIQSTNVGTPRNNTNHKLDYLPMVITSSWKERFSTTKDPDENDSEETDDQSPSMNNIQVILTIPYSIPNGSILNQTVSIIDITHNQIIRCLIQICINESSFIISYSTEKSLPHNVCLYLLWNMSISKEMLVCQMINKNFSTDTKDGHGVGPSAFFIISQSVVILLMMLCISVAHTAKNRQIGSRIGQHLFRIKRKALVKSSGRSSNPENIGQENNFILTPIKEQILAVTDLTRTRNDRRNTIHDLIYIKEFTKRMSVTMKDAESSQL